MKEYPPSILKSGNKRIFNSIVNLTGEVYGLLKVIDYDIKNKKWICKCECGNKVLKSAKYLKLEKNKYQKKSCGCLTYKDRGIPIQEIYDEAKKYTKREDFKKGSPSHHRKARKLGIYQDVVKHIPITALNSHKRGLYVYTWPLTMEAYVGLTWDYEERFKNHLIDKSSKVYEKVIINGDKEYFIETFKERKYPASVAAQMERDLISDLKERGFTLLNGDKGGALGGSKVRWTKSRTIKVLESEIKKFREKNKDKKGIKFYLQEYHSQAYNAAARNGWLEELWKRNNVKNVYQTWTDEKLIDYCKGMEYKRDLYRSNYALYQWADVHDKWDLVPHLKLKKNINRTKESVIHFMKKCITSGQFKKEYPNDYDWCVRNKILQECYNESGILVSKSNGKPVKDTLTGKVYVSSNDCARKMGIPESTMLRKLKTKNRFINLDI